jgi:hypothetical protein
MIYFKQCTLQHENTHTVAWIEEWGAVVGKIVKLKDSDYPEQLWKVTEAGSHRIEKSQALEEARKAHEFKMGGSIAKN